MNVVEKVEGRTPLHVACGLAQESVVRMLLEHGADAQAVDAFDATPMHVAVEVRSVEIVSLLLDAKVSLDAKDKNVRAEWLCGELGVMVNCRDFRQWLWLLRSGQLTCWSI